MAIRLIKRILLAAIIMMVIAILYLLVPFKQKPAANIKWGVAFTKEYAEYLGLDWQQVYLAMVDDLDINAVRVGINWNEIESIQGQFDFKDYDWMFDQAESRGIKILPVIGFKLPRWPECRAPEWAKKRLPKGSSFLEKSFGFGTGDDWPEFEQAELNMVKEVVNHFKDRKNIEEWQIENEVFIGWFGDCPPIPDSFVKKEVELVRSLDPRPIVMTESGELSVGYKSAFLADIIGSTLYRQVWSPIFGMVTYPIPPSFYAHKADLFKPWISKYIISELQLEVWASNGIHNMPIEEQLNQLPPEKIKEYMEYAKRTGIDEVYTWGVEWWWWLKTQGYPQLWETVREEFAK